MKRILIFGDSWSVVPADMPRPDGKNTYAQQRSNWTDFQLMQRGHYVYNIGRCAESNAHSIAYAEQILQGFAHQNLPIDLIVWYHTESMRDFTNKFNLRANDRRAKLELDLIKKIGIDAFIDNLAETSYNRVTKLKHLYPSTQWVIIGGHAPIRASKKHLLDWADVLIENWRSEITGIDCPDCQCYTLIRFHGFEFLLDSLTKEIVEREMTYANRITEACRNPDLFYDGVHPAGQPNQQITKLLIEKFNL
jgi:hypothetical protein